MAEQKLPPVESQRDQALAAMRQAPGRIQQGNGPIGSGLAEAGQKASLYHMAQQAADFLDQIGADTDDAARLFRSECERLAREYRNLTDTFMARLFGRGK